MKMPIIPSDTTLLKMCVWYNKNTLYGLAHYHIRHNTPIHVGLHIQQKSHRTERPITASDTTLPYLCDYIFKKNRIYNLQTFNRQLLMFSCLIKERFPNFVLSDNLLHGADILIPLLTSLNEVQHLFLLYNQTCITLLKLNLYT